MNFRVGFFWQMNGWDTHPEMRWIWHIVFQHLSVPELLIMASVSRAMYALARCDTAWSARKSLIISVSPEMELAFHKHAVSVATETKACARIKPPLKKTKVGWITPMGSWRVFAFLFARRRRRELPIHLSETLSFGLKLAFPKDWIDDIDLSYIETVGWLRISLSPVFLARGMPVKLSVILTCIHSNLHFQVRHIRFDGMRASGHLSTKFKAAKPVLGIYYVIRDFVSKGTRPACSWVESTIDFTKTFRANDISVDEATPAVRSSFERFIKPT